MLANFIDRLTSPEVTETRGRVANGERLNYVRLILTRRAKMQDMQPCETDST